MKDYLHILTRFLANSDDVRHLSQNKRLGTSILFWITGSFSHRYFSLRKKSYANCWQQGL